MSMMFEHGAENRQFKLSEKLLLINWPFLLLISVITLVGVAALYSVAGGSLEPWANRHVVRFCLGIALLFIVAVSDLRWWLRFAYPLYFGVLLLLALVPVIGVESGGAQRWIGFGEYSFQPSEILKIVLVIALARYYQWLPPEKIWRPDALVPPLLMIGLPTVLALVQPDLGTAALFAIVGCGIMFLAGVSYVYFLGAVVGIIVVLPHIWERLHDYQKERVLTLIDPERDPLGSGYHILQSKIAIGSGGLMGKGFMQGTQAQLNFLPEKHTDFIFTMFAEEMGFIGAACSAHALPSRATVHCLYGAQVPQHVRRTDRRGDGPLPVRLCIHQRRDGDRARARGRRAAAARLLWRHLDADHDGRLGLRVERPCKSWVAHQARGARAAVVRRGTPLRGSRPTLDRARWRVLEGAPLWTVNTPMRLASEGGMLGRIAQVVEQLTLNQRVVGSNPTAPTNKSRTCDIIGYRHSDKVSAVYSDKFPLFVLLLLVVSALPQAWSFVFFA